jgi:hypothetical protein
MVSLWSLYDYLVRQIRAVGSIRHIKPPLVWTYLATHVRGYYDFQLFEAHLLSSSLYNQRRADPSCLVAHYDGILRQR